MRRSSSAAAAVALVVVLCGGPAAADDDGKAIYEIRCAPCHGSTGTGDGPAAAALMPKPRNFRDASFWRGRSRTSLKMTVEQGRPGTMMSPFKGVLTDAEIDGVVRYVESFRPAQ